MAKINRVMVGESLVGDGNEIAHIDLILGPRGSAAETAFCNCLTNNKDGFTALLAVVAPNLMCKPNTVMFNKVTIKGAKQAVQMFGPAQRAVAMAVADSVEDGTIPAAEADDIFVSVGVFIHWQAEDDAKIQDFNYRATREAISRAVAGEPRAAEVVAKNRSKQIELTDWVNSAEVGNTTDTYAESVLDAWEVHRNLAFVTQSLPARARIANARQRDWPAELPSPAGSIDLLTHSWTRHMDAI